MNSDSLDWIWEDFQSSKANESNDDLLLSDDEDDHLMYDGIGGDDKSDDGSNLSFGDSLLVGDQKTLQELNVIVDDVKKQYFGGKADDVDDDDDDQVELCEGEYSSEERDCDEHGTFNRFYVDAMEAVENKLSEVQLAWTDTLNKCTVNG